MDASLNNYVALHYASRHMSWLHCMWGIGASIGPYVMGYALANGQSWNRGYGLIAMFQVVLTAVLIFSLPLWKRPYEGETGEVHDRKEPLSLKKICVDSRRQRGDDHIFLLLCIGADSQFMGRQLSGAAPGIF